MFYLLLSLAAGTAMELVFKYAAAKKLSGEAIVFLNYVTASCFTLISALTGESLTFTLSGAFSDLSRGGKTAAASLLLCILLGILQGSIFVNNLLTNAKSAAENGAGLTAFFKRGGFLGFAILSAVIWREVPGPVRILGIVLLGAGVLLMCTGMGELNAERPSLFIILFVNSILVQLIMRCFDLYALGSYKTVYMLFVYLSALAGFFVIKSGKGGLGPVLSDISAPVLVCGIVLGVCNVYNSLLQLKAMETLPPSVVFPTNNAGSLVLVYLTEKLLLREKTCAREIAAVILTAAGLVLVNI